MLLLCCDGFGRAAARRPAASFLFSWKNTAYTIDLLTLPECSRAQIPRFKTLLVLMVLLARLWSSGVPGSTQVTRHEATLDSLAGQRDAALD
jgi:hypothetical protein